MCPVLQARILASNKNEEEGTTRSWTLPVYFSAMGCHSSELSDANGKDIILHSRIAKELGISDGDEVDFELYEFSESYRLPVAVCDDIVSDFTIRGTLHLNLFQSFRSSHKSHDLISMSGIEVRNIPYQIMFTKSHFHQRRGECILYFDGGCKNNSYGPTGYGFYIESASGEKLIQGYGFDSAKRSSNYMQYSGLIEGLRWAQRLLVEQVEIRGDSSLIINQIRGTYRVENKSLKMCCDKVRLIMSEDDGVEFLFGQISRAENEMADKMAIMGMDRQENKVEINWNNVNKIMRATKVRVQGNKHITIF